MSISVAAFSPRAHLEIRSAVPGRYRIWVAGLYHNEEMKRALERHEAGVNASRLAMKRKSA